MPNPYSEALGRALSDAEVAQSKVRLVRLDAEGNPVDGSEQTFGVDRMLYHTAPETVDETVFGQLLNNSKRVTFGVTAENLSPETIKLFMGEDDLG